MKAIRDTLLFMDKNVQSPKSHFQALLEEKAIVVSNTDIS